MHAYSEQSPGGERGRKRPRVDKTTKSKITNQPQVPNSVLPSQQSANGASSGPETAAPISFEARIALALQGNNWQELQNPTNYSATVQEEIVNEEAADEDEEESEDDDADEEVETGDSTDADAADEPQKPPVLSAKQKRKRKQFAQAIERDAGGVLHTIDLGSLVPVAASVTWDGDPELLCCYNWQASTDNTNTIFVPGEPAKWSPPTLPTKVAPDSGFEYNDYNYARQPRTPYEPMFQALTLMNPTYQFTSVDILADRNNLRVLLEFCQGKFNGPFRLDLYLIYNTLVVVRNEGKYWKFSDGKSHGFNFERFFTTPLEGMQDATSHYRAIRYHMGPLSIVCRFEADAYDDGVAADLSSSEYEAVAGGLAARPMFKYGAPIKVLQKGHVVPTSQIVELKTQAKKEEFRPVTCQDQLWFGRTALLYTGPYVPGSGEVSTIRYEDARARVKNWEENQQESLRKLASLLGQLRDTVKRVRAPNHAAVLVREEKGGPLTIRSMNGMHKAVGREAFATHWRMTGRGGGQRGGYVPRGQGDFNRYRGGGQGQGFIGGGGMSQRGGRGGYVPQGYGRGGYVPQFDGRGGRGQYPPQGTGRGGHAPQYDRRGGRGGQGRGQQSNGRGGNQGTQGGQTYWVDMS